MTTTAPNFYALGYAAAIEGSHRAPILCPEVHDWMHRHDPEVGDGTFVAVCGAYAAGYDAALNDQLAQALGL